MAWAGLGVLGQVSGRIATHGCSLDGATVCVSRLHGRGQSHSRRCKLTGHACTDMDGMGGAGCTRAGVSGRIATPGCPPDRSAVCVSRLHANHGSCCYNWRYMLIATGQVSMDMTWTGTGFTTSYQRHGCPCGGSPRCVSRLHV
jgi:hypothetical protein